MTAPLSTGLFLDLRGGREVRTLRIVERCALPADFPQTPGFPEASYLEFAVAICE